MNLFTILFNACLHIIVVMVIEGVILFAVFIPLINWCVGWITELINNQIYNFINPNNNNNNNNNTNPINKDIPEYIYGPDGDWMTNPKYDNSYDQVVYINGKWY